MTKDATKKSTKSKKEILEEILEKLIPYRDMAEWFLLLTREDGNEQLKEDLYQEILKQIRNINSKTQQEKIKWALEKLKEKSNAITKSDEEEAAQMLNDFLDNI